MKNTPRKIDAKAALDLPSSLENTKTETASIPLYEAPGDARVRIRKICGVKNLRRQLLQMGIHPGDIIKVKRRIPFGGALLIEHRGAQLALSKGFADQIAVEIIA